jgi:peptidoglycan glycosyltransferase
VGRRIRWLGIVLILCFGLILVQLTNIQFHRAAALSASQYNPRNSSAHTDNLRGDIFAADGTILAQSVPATAGAYKYQRVYPQGALYGEVVGYDSVQWGTFGVEQTYNTQLSKHTQPATTIGQLLSPPPPTTDNVTLTIQPKLQQAAQTALNNIDSAVGYKDGAVVAIDPTTGAVEAMYSNPSFDPTPLVSPYIKIENAGRAAQSAVDAEGFSARQPISYSEIFPPGSTFKVITTSTVFDLKPALANYSFPTAPCISLPNSNKLLCNDGSTPATADPCGGNMSAMLPASCDPGYGQLGLLLGGTLLNQQAEAFGYNQVPPIDLPDVVASNFPSVADFGLCATCVGPPGVAYSAIGQEDVAASALQNALVASGIADGGVVMTPHVMAEIRQADNGQLVTTYQPKPWLRATTQATAAEVTVLMQAVATRGTAAGRLSPGLNAAVKTGTAQTGRTDAAANTDDWMIGFAPANDPKIAVAVVVPYQEISTSGAEVAGPIMNCMLTTALDLTDLGGVGSACPAPAPAATPTTSSPTTTTTAAKR